MKRTQSVQQEQNGLALEQYQQFRCGFDSFFLSQERGGGADRTVHFHQLLGSAARIRDEHTCLLAGLTATPSPPPI